MTAPVLLSGWYTRRPKLTSPYLAPEVVGFCVAGTVHGHPKRPDGSRVTTSRVVRVDGLRFWTESGTAYELTGEPDQRHLDALAQAGRTFDPKRPIGAGGGAK